MNEDNFIFKKQERKYINFTCIKECINKPRCFNYVYEINELMCFACKNDLYDYKQSKLNEF